MPGLFSRILSMGSDKQLKEFRKIAARVNDLEPQFQKMDDAELRGQTAKFRERNANGESLDDLLPEAFAAMREASQRTIGQRHFDVQLVGGIALHKGWITPDHLREVARPMAKNPYGQYLLRLLDV